MALLDVLGSQVDLITREGHESAAKGLVVTRSDFATQWIDSLYADINGLIGIELAQPDSGWERTHREVTRAGMFGLNNLNLEEPGLAALEIPTIEDIDFEVPPPENLDEDLIIDPGPDEDYDIIPPDPPTPPPDNWPIFDEDEPVVSQVPPRDEPDLDIPGPLEIPDISVPPPPEYNPPDFDIEPPPTEDLDMPDTMFVYNEAEYDSDLKNQLADKLYNEIALGGTGLDEDTEQAIFNRAISRLEEEEQELQDRTLDFFGDRGHTLPPATLAGLLVEADNKILRARTDLNNDILVQQSKLAQENTHFMIDRAIVFEKNLMDYINQYQNRALEAAKFAVLSVIEVYKARASIYTAKLEAYKVRAQIYMTRIQAEMVRAEFYKAQIEGVKATVDVHRARVDIYRARIGAAQALVDMYKAQIEADNMVLNRDALVIQLYGKLIDAFQARVNAQTARWNGYQAQIAGEVSKVEYYKAQVQAYAARVQAYAAEVDALVKEYQGHIAGKQSEVEVYKARLMEYTTEADVAMKQVGAEVTIEELKVDAYKSEIAKYGTEIDALGKLYQGRVQETKNYSDAYQVHNEMLLKEALEEMRQAQENLRTKAKAFATMAASSISGFSASAHIGYAESRADSQSTTLQEYHGRQEVISVNTNNNHYYNHDT